MNLKNLLEVLKKAMNIFDLFILAAAFFFLTGFDYSNLSTANIIYLVVLILWFIMFFIRIFIVYRNLNKK